LKYPKIILCVDDDPDDRYLLCHAISRIDRAIVFKEAQHGPGAIEILTHAKSFGDLPSLIMLDMNMPLMDGIQTFKAIKKDTELSQIPIVVFSTSDREEEVSYWKSENVPMVTKPSGFTELVSCVENIISRYLPSE
jgi:CheY-like chemotaxis protein